jgi:predicted nucleic acid-binding protein
VLVVDASCLYAVVADTPQAKAVAARLLADQDHAAPHLVDVEVLNVIRRDHLSGHLDATAAAQAVDDLRAWPGERFGHGGLLARAWDLRHNVRGWDAVYVALAEALEATLITLDGRLSRVEGLACPIELVG